MTKITDGVVNRHLEYCALKNLSPLTIRGRRCALERLGRYLNAPVLYASHDELYDWQRERAKVLQPGTRRTELTEVREFYRWATREGFITADPTIRLVVPKVPRRLPRPMKDERVAAALHNADAPMAAIIGLATYGGLRACEVARLNWADVTLDGPDPALVVVYGKNGKSRRVPLSPALRRILAALPDRRGPVIVRADGLPGHTTPMAVTKRASRHLKECGIPDRLHAIRHRFATVALQVTHDIRAVQEILGHSSPSTTALYTATSSAAARDAVEAAGSLAA